MADARTDTAGNTGVAETQERLETPTSVSLPPLTLSEPGGSDLHSSSVSGTIVPSSGVVARASLSPAGTKEPSPVYTNLPKPPPLIAVSSLQEINAIPKAQATVKLKTEPGPAVNEGSSTAPVQVGKGETTEGLAAPGTLKSSTKLSETETSKQEPMAKSIVTSQVNTGGLGAGKPKAFLAMMNSPASTPKKQTRKPAIGGGGSGGRGQGSKSKSSPLSGSSKKSAVEVAPSRSSNRNIKRPRTYEEEMDEMKATARATVKKAKTTSKVPKATVKKPAATAAPSSMKDLGRWRPTDDLMLISAVQQTNDLSAVHLGVNFSCRFTLQEVEERWHALLYDARVSQMAIEAIQGLHPGVVTMALNNALWSQEEEAVLARIPPTDPGHLEKFQAVLKENPAVFHMCRTATSLHHHWVLMGHNNLLNTQKVDIIPALESVKEFKDAEDHLEDSELTKSKDVREVALEQELIVSDRHSKMEIMKLEEELPMWRTVLDTGSPPEFGPNDYALFKGKVVEYRMNKRTVYWGRSTASSTVDFDLSMEGPAFKISRRQAVVQLTDSGEFLLYNEGKRPIYVSGKVVLPRTSTSLQHNQTIEITSLAFLVSLNLKLANSLKSNT